MSTCTAEEIAEKKRVALEKLKSKKLEIKVNSDVTPKQNNLVPVESKTTSSFYKRTENKASDFLRTIKENQSSTDIPRSPRNSCHPYNNPKSQEQRIGKVKTCQDNKSSLKLASVFIATTTCNCYLISDTRFGVNASNYHSKIIDLFKTIPSRAYDPLSKVWSFDLNDYQNLLKRSESLRPNIILNEIPQKILNLCLKPIDELNFSCLSAIERKLANKLLPFQKEGVCFGISKHGRVLIADEMGLGKTYQALAIADFYRDDWPLLICTTVSTRDSWRKHVKDLLPYVASQHIVCITSNQQSFGDAKVLISSYNIMERYINQLLEKRFGVLIMDESHTLKNQKAKCTIMADRLARQARRIILLSGTPALSRPLELFTQIQMIDRSFFNFMDYTTRYCDGKQTAFGWVATGQSNLPELNVILKRKFMIRRLKENVLPQLSDKCRETVILDSSLVCINDKTNNDLSTFALNLSRSKGREKEEILLRFYALTAAAKVNAVCAYLKTLIKECTKFIIFAHHKVMMDGISNCLKNLNICYVKIDGSTRTDLRTQYVEKFQNDTLCQVAVLSIKACNAGITLTAAQLVVFAELDWNPSTLAQAESRAHRIGQESTVTCRYLLANKTADDIIWDMLKTKQDVLRKVGLINENLQDANYTLAPSSEPKIDSYLKKMKTSNVEEIPKVQCNDSKLNNSTSIEFESLLNDDDEDFANLNF